MKKILAMLLSLSMCVSLVACGDEKESKEEKDEMLLNTDHITIDYMCVDDSYEVEEGSSLKLLYMFYTLKATDENLKIDSTYTDLTINDTNKYTSTHIPKVCKYMPSYTYTSYIQDVYVGEEMKVVATFKIPEAELAAGKDIVLSDNQLPDEENLKIKTDIIKRYENAEEMAKEVDAEGYAEVMDKYTVADPETASLVSSMIDGYYFSFYVNATAYQLEFFPGNRFELRTSLGIGNGGSYVVKKGYVACTYDSNGTTVDIPYTMENGNIKLNAADAFDVNEG